MKEPSSPPPSAVVQATSHQLLQCFYTALPRWLLGHWQRYYWLHLSFIQDFSRQIWSRENHIFAMAAAAGEYTSMCGERKGFSKTWRENCIHVWLTGNHKSQKTVSQLFCLWRQQQHKTRSSCSILKSHHHASKRNNIPNSNMSAICLKKSGVNLKKWARFSFEVTINDKQDD
jgi:hypothetical protein